jgi:hypothetical protein
MTPEQKQALAKARARLRIAERYPEVRAGHSPSYTFDEPSMEMPAPGMAGAMVSSPTPEFRQGAKDAYPYLMAGGVGLATGGLPLLGQAAIEAGAFGGADIARQALFEDDIDLTGTAKKSAAVGGTAFAAGSLFKFLFPKLATTTELSKAKDYARANKLPQPLTMPGKAGVTVGRASVLGELEYARQLRRFATAIDEHIVKAGQKFRGSVDDVFVKARDTLKELFDARAGYKGIKDLVPGETPIDLSPFIGQVDEMLLELKAAGETKELLTVFENLSDAAKQGKTANTFDVVDGLLQKISTASTSQGHAVVAQARQLIGDSIEMSLSNNPQITGALMNTGKTITELMSEANVSYGQIAKIQKDFPNIKKMMNSNSPGQFLKFWSENKVARHAVKDVLPETADDLNKAWLGKNIERYIYGKNGRDLDVINIRGDDLLEFMDGMSDDIIDMFGQDGYDSIRNLGFYLKYAGDYGGKVAGDTPMRVMGQLGAETFMLGGKAIPIEGGGYMLVHEIMKPNSALNLIFSGVDKAARTVAKKVNPQAAGENLPGQQQR